MRWLLGNLLPVQTQVLLWGRRTCRTASPQTTTQQARYQQAKELTVSLPVQGPAHGQSEIGRKFLQRKGVSNQNKARIDSGDNTTRKKNVIGRRGCSQSGIRPTSPPSAYSRTGRELGPASSPVPLVSGKASLAGTVLGMISVVSAGTSGGDIGCDGGNAVTVRFDLLLTMVLP